MSMESAFQFTRPALQSLTVKIHDSFKPAEETGIPINVETRVKKQQLQDTGEKTAEVVLCVTIGKEEDNSTPFFIVAEESAHFKWPAGEYDEDATTKLLKGNAPALLLSYLRPIVAMVTSASVFPGYNIPFIDLTKPDASE